MSALLDIARAHLRDEINEVDEGTPPMDGERAREAAVDSAWDRLRQLHDRCGRPDGWLTGAVRDAEAHAEALWLAARKRPPFDPDFYEALGAWERLAADAIRRAADSEAA